MGHARFVRASWQNGDQSSQRQQSAFQLAVHFSGALAVSTLTMRSHSRPNEVPIARRRRMLERPRQQFRSQTGRAPQDKGRFFLLTPTDPSICTQVGRSEAAAPIRRAIKHCRSRKGLLDHLASASCKGLLDTSVLAASLQTCGNQQWWDTLKAVLALGREGQVPFNGIALCVLFRALVSCVRTFGVPPKPLSRRKEHALKLAKRALGDYVPVSEIDFNSLLSSMCRLCDEIGSAAALAWADEKWSISEGFGFRRDIVTYCTRLQLLERHGRQKEVDVILRNYLTGPDLSPNAVVLGGLVNAAATNCDWKRADKLWSYLVGRRHVEPHEPAYLAFAKAHLLSGKPAEAACIIEDMLAKGFGADDYKVAVDYLQSLVVVAHSAPTPANLSKLTSALANADLVAAATRGNVPNSARVWWGSLSQVVDALQGGVLELRLKDVLVTSNAKEHSIMKDWENFQAGSAYLGCRS
ncbi:unnamed protein product [Effrenium voratum]|uniref:Pentatricopeptide repeat-containing protein n=1 Tax=Effrenium voratum TaxID=2562239 RepID=A0AA36IL33_9DINO|nr:unnamed protein product [Effrenium voratum]